MAMESSQEISVENGADVTIVILEERNILEDRQIRKLERALIPIIRTNPDKRLVLNLAKVRFVSSSLLGLLVRVDKRLLEAGGHLQLSNLDGKMRRVLEITRLARVFDIVAGES
ncbi:MAG: STAS domain-containing protein [Sedimentisphaerales bacterium]|nr:STAS domain-containing protein [Sedimentisphaerales bacterium]